MLPILKESVQIDLEEISIERIWQGTILPLYDPSEKIKNREDMCIALQFNSSGY
jgi:hypothetical protein